MSVHCSVSSVINQHVLNSDWFFKIFTSELQAYQILIFYMNMYYQGNTEIQADGLQKLYRMNPNYNAYSDTSQQSGNMFIFNYPAGNGINHESLANGNQPQPHPHLQHLVGVPLQAGSLYSTTITTTTPGRRVGDGSTIAHLHQNLWSSLDHENQENGNVRSGVVTPRSYGGCGQAEVSFAQLGYHHLPSVSPTRQGLSLSLSSQQHHNINHLRNLGMGSPGTGGGNYQASGGGGACSSVSEINNTTNGIQRESSNFVLESKYLKAAQELLDEVVNIAAKEIKVEKDEKEKSTNKESITMSRGDETSGVGVGDTSMTTDHLTTAQKQEIQMKKAKLITILDEVEQRYAQYHHQMQIVVTTFEHATGVGSARSYTQLALKTISTQFRCLKDAISTQIKTASKNLGLEEILEGKIHGSSSSSRLKFVDQQLRQQKALQHFGMIQTNNVWRPQRGLPERAVSVLRAWLFEHFLHPYPKDSDKVMLAKQTGLTRSQVSNWFINARVRLWKPMVEEMYTEEMKNQEAKMGSESNNQDHSATIKSASPNDYNMTMMMTDKDNNNTKYNQEKETSHDDISEKSRFGLVTELNNSDGVSDKNPKRQRPVDHHHHYHHMQNSPISTMLSSVDMMDAKHGDPRVIGNGLIGAFSFGDLENFNPEQLTTGFHGNNGDTGGSGGSGGRGGRGGVSLTLGLPPSDQQNFFLNQNMELRNTHDHMNIGYNESLHFPNS